MADEEEIVMLIGEPLLRAADSLTKRQSALESVQTTEERFVTYKHLAHKEPQAGNEAGNSTLNKS